MNSRSKAPLERLGPVRAVPRRPCGSAGTVRLSPNGVEVRKVTLALALASRGLSMREARDAVDAMLERGEVVVDLPTVEDRWTLESELRENGASAIIEMQEREALRLENRD